MTTQSLTGLDLITIASEYMAPASAKKRTSKYICDSMDKFFVKQFQDGRTAEQILAILLYAGSSDDVYYVATKQQFLNALYDAYLHAEIALLETQWIQTR